MQHNNIRVGITHGDCNGVGYEVIIKSLADPRILDCFTPIIYGSSKAFGFYKKTIHNIDSQIETHVITNVNEAKHRKINILNCCGEDLYVEPGQVREDAAIAAIQALECAVDDIKKNMIDVLVTGPINKKNMVDVGFKYTGHTEYLQDQFNAKDVAMIMVSDLLKIGIVTGHMPLKEVTSSLTTEKILDKLRVINKSLITDYGIIEPKIAVLGLNPHCGDDGLLGDEEINIISPAIKLANEEGISAFGPYSPDGYFGLSNFTNFDATLAMYHDQGLAPFKALAFETGVNYTAGLPIIRTSPDHGTAFNMAGMDKADPMSMKSAIYTAVDIFKCRQNWENMQKHKIDEKFLNYNQNSSQGKSQIV